MFDNLMNIVTVVSLLVGLLGVILAVVFYYKGKTKRKLSWAKSTYQLIENKESTVNGLEMTFNKEPIDDLSVTRIVLWNSGNEVIRDSDIDGENPIRIVNGNDSRILQVSILHDSDKRNRFDKDIGKNNNQLSFKFINEREGAAIQIIHTGKAPVIEVNGEIIGGKIKEIDYSNVFGRLSYADVIIIGWVSGASIGYVVGRSDYNYIMSIIACLICCIISIATVLSIDSIFNRLTDPKYRIPKDLREFIQYKVK